ncbi:MAG: hypothetical protein AAFR26_15340 [Cyanobacteria bacterium J06626_4]
MTLPNASERALEQAKLLLAEYSFDLSGFRVGELMAIWQEHLKIEPSWIRAAVLEALYQGRYKAFSVEQILQGWKRRGHPVRHFNSEFERIVFGPIDPLISKYAPLTGRRPSELMAPQSPTRQPTLPPTTSSEPLTSSEPVASPPEPPIAPSPDVADSVEPSEPDAAAVPNPPTTPSASRLVAAPTPASATELPQPVSRFHHPAPIQKFTPQLEASEFYHRLQSVARDF